MGSVEEAASRWAGAAGSEACRGSRFMRRVVTSQHDHDSQVCNFSSIQGTGSEKVSHLTQGVPVLQQDTEIVVQGTDVNQDDEDILSRCFRR